MITIDVVERMRGGQLVAHFLLNSYLYYVQHVTAMDDEVFDRICVRLRANWKGIKHPHKAIIDYAALDAGTGFYLARDDYPLQVQGAAKSYYNRCRSGEILDDLEPHLLPATGARGRTGSLDRTRVIRPVGGTRQPAESRGSIKRVPRGQATVPGMAQESSEPVTARRVSRGIQRSDALRVPEDTGGHVPTAVRSVAPTRRLVRGAASSNTPIRVSDEPVGAEVVESRPDNESVRSISRVRSTGTGNASLRRRLRS